MGPTAVALFLPEVVFEKVPEPMDYELVIVQGRSASSTLKLGEGVTTIGRHDECQLRIKSSQVSRKHCELFEKKGLLLVKDLGSSNGTLVNGKRVQGQRVLEPGDELSIGPVLFRVAKVGEVVNSGSDKVAPSPGDTAVTAPVASTGDPGGFSIDFDEPTQAPDADAVVTQAPMTSPAPAAAPKAPAKKKATAHDEDAIADFLMDVEIDGDDDPTVPAPAPSPAKPANNKAANAPQAEADKEETAPKPVEEVTKEPGVSDDAIADFLLDIKLDED